MSSVFQDWKRRCGGNAVTASMFDRLHAQLLKRVGGYQYVEVFPYANGVVNFRVHVGLRAWIPWVGDWTQARAESVCREFARQELGSFARVGVVA